MIKLITRYFSFRLIRQQNEKDDESISEAESDIQEADLQVANDIFGSTENLPTDAKEDDDDVIDEHDDNIVSSVFLFH